MDARSRPTLPGRDRAFFRLAFLGLSVMTLLYASYCHDPMFHVEHLRTWQDVRMGHTVRSSSLGGGGAERAAGGAPALRRRWAERFGERMALFKSLRPNRCALDESLFT